MGSGVVVVIDVLADNAVQMVGMDNEHMVEAFPSQATDEAFADGIRLGCSNRSLQHVDARAFGNVGEPGAILVISLANEILGACAPRRCFTQLLCGPVIGRGTGHSGMDDSSSLKVNDDQDVQRPEEQVMSDGEVSGPNVCSVILQESGPGLARLATSLAYTSESFAH